MNTNLLAVLARAGVGSRRKIAAAIISGRVTVNGETADNLRQPVNPDADRVTFAGRPVNVKPEKTVRLILNKPAGIISTTSDEKGRWTVLDILPGEYRHLRLYPVGRLDKDSTGLLLLTNDGDLTNRLTHPRFEQEKEYLVQLEGKLKPEDRVKLERGIELEDGKTSPGEIKDITTASPFNYSFIIHEGKKRQVRRMFASLGYKVIALKRIRMGNIRLGELKEGQVRELSAGEVAHLIGPY